MRIDKNDKNENCLKHTVFKIFNTPNLSVVYSSLARYEFF